MLMILSALLILSAGILSLVTITLLIEVVAGLFYRSALTLDRPRPRATILIPAHNEELLLPDTLSRLRGELASGDRVLVVADNCSDATAVVARRYGAEVFERKDDLQRGKGFALDAGIRVIAAGDEPDIVVVLDADCHFAPGSLTRLLQASDQWQRPVQALYLMTTAGARTVQMQVKEFAWVVKNKARPYGLAALQLPCQLMGTGMAIPWPCLQQISLATGNIVEDLQLGLDFASAGKAARFCGEATVFSTFPDSEAAGNEQRRRWEHGQLGLIVDCVPGLLVRAVKTRDWALLSLILDLCVPPLSLLLQLLLVVMTLSVLLTICGGSILPLLESVFALVAFVTGLSLAWYVYGRPVLSWAAVAAIPRYLVEKLPLYLGFFRRRQREWVRAKRG